MTKVLNFTSVAAAPVSERIACGLLDSGCVHGLAISREIIKEVANLRADQHVKIKVGSLLAIVADHEYQARKLTQAMNDYDGLSREKQQAIDDLQKVIVNLQKQNDEVVHLNRNAAEEIALLNKANEGLRATIDGINQEVEDLEKGNEHLDQTIATVVCQRDELSGQLAAAKSEIANLKRRLDGEVRQSAAVYENIRAHSESEREQFLKRIAVLEGERDEAIKLLSRAKSDVADYEQLVKDREAGTAVDRNTIKRQEESIQWLYGQLNEWSDWAMPLVNTPSNVTPEGLRTAISTVMKKRQERIDSLEATVKAIAAQRDVWVLWAKSYTDTCAVAYTNDQLLSLVKAEVTSREKAVYDNGYQAGKIAANKKSHETWSIKTDGPAVMNGTVKAGGVADRCGAMIENAVVMRGSVLASKVTFSDEMKAAIREVVQAVMDEALKQAIQNEVKKLLK